MAMVAAEFEAQRQWQSTMTSLVSDDLLRRLPLEAASSDVNSRTLRRQLGHCNETQTQETRDQFRSVEDHTTSAKNIRRDRTKGEAYYTGLSNVFGALSLTSQNFSTTTTPTSSSGDSDEDKQYSTQSLFIIRPALWLARFGIKYGIRVEIFQLPGQWKHVLNTFRPVPDDSLIFEFCKSGNIDSAQLFLRSGKASVWDTNSDGHTPLHVSSYSLKVFCTIIF